MLGAATYPLLGLRKRHFKQHVRYFREMLEGIDKHSGLISLSKSACSWESLLNAQGRMLLEKVWIPHTPDLDSRKSLSVIDVREIVAPLLAEGTPLV